MNDCKEYIRWQLDKLWYNHHSCGREIEWRPSIRILDELRESVEEYFETWLRERADAFSEKERKIREAGGTTPMYQGWGYICDSARMLAGEEVLYHDYCDDPFWAHCYIDPDETMINSYNTMLMFLDWQIHPRYRGLYKQGELFK